MDESKRKFFKKKKPRSKMRAKLETKEKRRNNEKVQFNRDVQAKLFGRSSISR